MIPWITDALIVTTEMPQPKNATRAATTSADRHRDRCRGAEDEQEYARHEDGGSRQQGCDCDVVHEDVPSSVQGRMLTDPAQC